VLIGLLFLAVVVAVAGLAFDSAFEASEEDRKEPPRGWY
jgi:hypothetical protein